MCVSDPFFESQAAAFHGPGHLGLPGAFKGPLHVFLKRSVYV